MLEMSSSEEIREDTLNEKPCGQVRLVFNFKLSPPSVYLFFLLGAVRLVNVLTLSVTEGVACCSFVDRYQCFREN